MWRFPIFAFKTKHGGASLFNARGHFLDLRHLSRDVWKSADRIGYREKVNFMRITCASSAIRETPGGIGLSKQMDIAKHRREIGKRAEEI